MRLIAVGLTVVLILFGSGFVGARAQTGTDTPTPTPTETATPGPSPTPTATASNTPGALYQYATLESGQTVALVYTVSIGEAVNAVLLSGLLTVAFFSLFVGLLRKRE